MRVRREYQRRERQRLTVRFRRAGTDEPSCSGYTENVSGAGLFVQTTQVLPPRTRLEIQVTVDDTVVNVTGIVEWARLAPVRLARTMSSGMGIRLDVPLEAREPAQLPA